MDKIGKIIEWAEAIEKHEIVSWDALPDLDLYMDQVITFMDRQFVLFQRDENNKLLTPNMINNYVKDGIIPRPENKKYSREHLALMLTVAMLKQVLSIQNISVIKKSIDDKEALFDKFTKVQTQAFNEIGQRVLGSKRDYESLQKLALELSLEANARRITSEMILAILGEDDGKQGGANGSENK